MKRYTFLLALLLNTTSIFAQTQGEFIIELNPETGTFTKTGTTPIPGIHYIYPEVRAYDEVNGRMIFPGGDPTPDHLYSIDVTNGNMICNPPFPATGNQTLSEPKFDNSTGTLFAMYHDNTTSSFYLASVDPVTGTPAQIGTTAVAGLGGLNQGMNTFDEINHNYILCTSNNLFAIDAQSGSSGSVALVVQPGDGLINMCFNNDNDTLYGLMRQGSSQLFFLVWIDQLTGVMTPIGSGTNLGNGNGSGTIDQVNRHYIYSYSTGGIHYVSVMDMDNGSILFNNQIILDNIDNVHSLTYDNIRQKLFAIHWDDLIDASDVADVKEAFTVIYPNPASDELSVRFAKNYQNMHVALYNITGQQVSSFDFRGVTECALPLHDISSGVYFLKFDTPEESFSARFIRQ